MAERKTGRMQAFVGNRRPDEKAEKKDDTVKPAGAKPASTKPAAGAAKKTKPKKKKPVEMPSFSDRNKLLSSFMRASIGEQAKKTGQSNIYVGGEAACMLSGIPLPSFSLEYLFGLNILPFGILLLLVGEEGLGKSGLAFEVARWFRRLAAGYVLYMENESKYSPTWAASILGWDDPEAMKVVRCNSMQDWQRLAQDDYTRFQEFCIGTEATPGPGKIFGYLQILDTLMGKATPESMKRIRKEGFAGRAHPDEARSITQLLRTHPQQFTGWPATFLVLNQLKVKAGENGRQIREMAGGQGIKFQVSYQLELKKNPTISHVSRGGWSISRLVLRSFKNAFAEDYVRRSIPINVCVRNAPQFDAQTGQVENRQQTVWDWYGSAIELILNLQEEKVRPGERLRADRRKALKELLPIRRGKGDRFSCASLGVSKDAPVSQHALGRLLHSEEHRETLVALRKLFGIQIWPGFDPTMTFDAQMDKARQIISERLQKICPTHVMSSGFDRNMDDSVGGDSTDGEEERDAEQEE